MAIVLRNSNYHLRKRVPRRYARIEARDYLDLSLHTDSELVAKTKATTVWQQFIEGWEAKLAGDTQDAEAQFEAARELAAKRGFRFLTSKKVADLPMEELGPRLEAFVAASRPGKPDMIEAAAVLGYIEEPKITVTRALELYWTIAEKDKTRGKSADQIRRWKNPRMKAFKNFVSVVGNKAMADITADDMLDFKAWWEERIELEDLTPNSANKDLTHLSDTLKKVNLAKRLGLTLPVSGFALSEGDKVTRPPFSEKWIREKILAKGALDELNLEARCIVLGMINTGYRPSEAAGLLSEHIRLKDDIPHISIEPVGRTLKSQYSRRVIPLVGVSLEAFKACPNGFARYRDNPNLSATVNKFFRENGLQETPKHTMYCLRHSFEDRMLAAEVDERIRRDLFGHTLNRERYGKGASLEHLLRVVQLIAI